MLSQQHQRQGSPTQPWWHFRTISLIGHDWHFSWGDGQITIKCIEVTLRAEQPNEIICLYQPFYKKFSLFFLFFSFFCKTSFDVLEPSKYDGVSLVLWHYQGHQTYSQSTIECSKVPLDAKQPNEMLCLSQWFQEHGTCALSRIY